VRFVAEPSSAQLMGGEFAEELLDLVDSDATIVLDFSGVKSITSKMISDLLVMHKAVRAHQGELILTGMSAHVVDVFKTTGLDKCFEIRPS